MSAQKRLIPAFLALLAATQAQAPAQAQEAGPTLVEALMPIYMSTRRDPCEAAYREKQLAVVFDLEARAPQIDSFAAQAFENEYWKVVPLGSTSVREPKALRKPRRGWIEDRSQ